MCCFQLPSSLISAVLQALALQQIWEGRASAKKKSIVQQALVSQITQLLHARFCFSLPLPSVVDPRGCCVLLFISAAAAGLGTAVCFNWACVYVYVYVYVRVCVCVLSLLLPLFSSHPSAPLGSCALANPCATNCGSLSVQRAAA